MSLDDASVNFFTTTAGIGFGIIGFGSTIEVISKASSSGSHGFRFIISIFLIGILVIGGSLAPLALDDLTLSKYIYSALFLIIASFLYLYLIFEIITRRVPIKFPILAISLYVITGIFLAICLSVGYYHGYLPLFAYKLAILWSILLLMVRWSLLVMVI